MKSILITHEVAVDFSSKLGTFPCYYTSNGYGPASVYANQYVAITISQGMSCVFSIDTMPDGTKQNIIMGNYAIRESSSGLQYFDNSMWRFFDTPVQEAYTSYVAEKMLLEEK